MIYVSCVALFFSLCLVYLTLFTKWELNSESKGDKFLMFLVWGGMFLGSLSDVITHFTTK